MPEPRWFALFVKSKHEFSVANSLRNKGYEEFLPVYKRSTPSRRDEKEVVLPLFPGYVLCRCDWNANRGAKIVTTPGVIRVIGTSKSPVPVQDDEVAALRALMKTTTALRPCPFLRIGDEVILQHGPLRGLKARVVNADSVVTLVVSVDLLQRSIAVTVPREWVVTETRSDTYWRPIHFCSAQS
jgi:transcription antitermination factor NusG